MKVLKATLAQKKSIEGEYLNGATLRFIQDANNNWVVNESVLEDANFESIKDKLSELPSIEYIPKIVKI